MFGLIAGTVIVLVVAIAIEERSGLLRVGAVAPDFSAPLSTGKTFVLSAYRGKNPVVLYFYPADFTAGCTQEACAFRDNYKQLEEKGVMLVAISHDPATSHARFSKEYALPFPLISDTNRAIGKAYGVDRLGGLIPLPKRVTYVIDTEGKVRASIHHEVMMQQHVADVIEALR